MTLIASCLALVLLVLCGATFYLPSWNFSHALLPSWAVWPVAATIGIGAMMFAVFATFIAAGGAVAWFRDQCEDDGLPYFPLRPRERISAPMASAIRRLIDPRGRPSPGDLVEVRSLEEILATLDEEGCLDGLPFMPEMAAYCGHRIPVHRRIDKVWEYAHGTGIRRVRNAVLLKTLRCDGRSHGGCQAACQLIWKEAWLKWPGSSAPAPQPSRKLDLHALTQVTGENGLRYVCQMTRIKQASTQLRTTNVAHYWRDLSGGNFRPFPLFVEMSVRLFNGLQWRLGRPCWPVLQPMDSDSSPHRDLGLQPGDMVRVRSKREIESTLNRHYRNRGMEFGRDMLFFCGGSYRVAARIDRMVHEGTGQLLLFKTPSILLEEVTSKGGYILGPQNEYFFWREIWLEPHPASARS